MEEVCRDPGPPLDVDLAILVAKLAIAELSGEANKQACDLLVALGRTHCSKATAAVLTRLEPGVTPYPWVIRTLGMLAAGNAFGVVPFIKVSMSVILPMLGTTKDDTLKQAFCYTIGRFCEAINEYLTNMSEAYDPTISKEMFEVEMHVAYDILTHTWLPMSRDLETTEAIVNAIGPLSMLLPPDSDGKRILKLVPILLSMCKKTTLRLAATRVLATLLISATEEERAMLHPLMENIHGTLSDLVCAVPFDASREAVWTHYEVLRCAHALVTLYAGEGLDRYLQQLKSPQAIQRSRALVVIRHLINTLPTEDSSALLRIALSLQESLNEGNTRQLVGAIAAIAAKSMILLSPDQRASFVKFMVIHSSSENEDGESCEEALNLLATTVTGAENWLWPLLLNFLTDPACSASVISVLRALTPMAAKIIRDEHCEALKKEFHGPVILGKCLELLSDVQNHIPVLTFLRFSALLIGPNLERLWEKKLHAIIFRLQNKPDNIDELCPSADPWEEEIVDLLEESVKLETGGWSKELSEDLLGRVSGSSGVAPFLAAVTTDVAHMSLLVDLTRTKSDDESYARAVGICSKHDLDTVLKLMEEFCATEDSRKVPVKLLGLMKDLKAAATAEAAKAGLLKCYGEIARRSNAMDVFSALDGHVLPWIIRQLNDAKELKTKEAGLLALEQVGNAAHSSRLPDSSGFRMRGPALASVLALLQTPSGHKPLQLYPYILKAVISLIRLPPLLSPDEREVLLSTLIQKMLAASSEINSLLLPPEIQRVLDGLGTVCGEVVSDSADALAELSDSLLPWMRSGSYFERKAALLTLRSTLRSYHHLLKYTYPGGKLEIGKLLGNILSRSCDPEPVFRTLVLDCVAVTLSISAKHRSTLPDNNVDHDLSEIKKAIINEDLNAVYEAVKMLATVASERVAGGEAVGLSEGLIMNLNNRGEGGLAAGISLTQHFKVRGSDLAHAAVHLSAEILAQLKHMENISCKKGAITAIKTLVTHHPHEVVEALLNQPLPLNKDTETCWKELGTNDELGLQVLDILLQNLTSNKMLDESMLSGCQEKNCMASFTSLSSVMALGHFFDAPNSDALIAQRLPELFFALLASMAAWLHVNAPVVTGTTKYGFVPNKETYRINPYHEAYTVLMQILEVASPNGSKNLTNGTIFESECKVEDSLISTVQTVVKSISNKENTIVTLARSVCGLATSILPAQRAVSAAFYAELVGRPGCGDVWLEVILNTLHEAMADSSPLVRRLAIVGLTRVSNLKTDQVGEYVKSSIDSLLEELEVPTGGEGGNEVTLECLRGLAVLLSVRSQRLPNPRVVLALKPFIDKESWEMRLATINALGAIARTWEWTSNTGYESISGHLLGCLPCLLIRLEDPNPDVADAVRATLHDSADMLQSETLASTIRTHLEPKKEVDIEAFFKELVLLMIKEIPQRIEELRNAVSRGYSRSENPSIRATSALILGLIHTPATDDVQRLLQLLRDTESQVRARAARALSMCFAT
ncbi:maestro heat-like repeat-containing protein family member 1 isoform X2 [Athalia rosae]|nr:maestro heat-like repeat-containing protein family member 1 isoform X2 [Athalia rosae]